MRAHLVNLCLLFLLAACSAEARAQSDANPDNWCRNGLFTREEGELRLARVSTEPAGRVHFWGDDDDCPDGPAARCRLKSYLVAGDEMIVSRRRGGFVCAWFQPRRGGETVGWLPADRLLIGENAPEPPPAAWAGHWKFYDSFIEIKRGRRAGELVVEGQAYWKGLGDNVHVGEINSALTPRGGRAIVEDDTCRVSLRLVGPYLVVNDNKQCGGVNVTFDGVYRKQPPRRARRPRGR
ncbi:MAG TPA: hypothetical protein VEY09_11115 [Pyrinomonadaceae bacterium]|nr:hypothetical protein [Pyrinomonadaceae bacterium]